MHADHFRYVDAPPVTGFATAACWTGGTLTVSGTDFYDVTEVSAVADGNVAPGSFDVQSPTSLTVEVPPGNPDDQASVVVTSQYGDSTGVPARSYTYVDSTSVTGVAPNNGSVDGGTVVTIDVNRTLYGPVQVLLDGDAVLATPVSDTQVTVTMPAHVAGTVTVAVLDATSCDGGTTGSFTYA